MMGTGVTFGVMAVVVTFLAAALGAFPLAGDSGGAGEMAPYVTDIDESGTLNADDVEKVGDMMLMSYTDLINDMVSFQHDPSIERAEARKESMVGFARMLTGQFRDFSESLQGELDDMVEGADTGD